MGTEKVAVNGIPSTRLKVGARNDTCNKLSWQRNPSVQKLLDVIVSIIAEEYIEIAKKNKQVFEIVSPRLLVRARNDKCMHGGKK